MSGPEEEADHNRHHELLSTVMHLPRHEVLRSIHKKSDYTEGQGDETEIHRFHTRVNLLADLAGAEKLEDAEQIGEES